MDKKNKKLPDSNYTEGTTNVNLPKKYDSLANLSAYSDTGAIPYKVSFNKVTTFGESKDTLFKGVSQFAVDEGGQVFIVNSKSIEVFSEEGNHVKTLGGKGKGPGEFNNMASLKPKIWDNELYVYDDILSRINIYDTNSLSYLSAISIDPRKWNHISDLQGSRLRDFQIYNDSLLLLEFEDLKPQEGTPGKFKRFYVMNYNSEVLSSEVFKYKLHFDKTLVWVSQDGNIDWPFPNASGRYMQVQFGPDNHIYTTRTEDFLIKIYTPSGKYERAIYYPYKNKPLDEQDIIDSYSKETLAQRAKDHEYPKTWPAIDYFFIDDEKRIWVATITEDESQYEWWILKNNGALLAKFKWPGKRLERADRFRVYPKVKNGFWYVKEVDTTTGIRQIVKYKMNFGKK